MKTRIFTVVILVPALIILTTTPSHAIFGSILAGIQRAQMIINQGVQIYEAQIAKLTMDGQLSELTDQFSHLQDQALGSVGALTQPFQELASRPAALIGSGLSWKNAWVEFLRDTGSATCNRVESLLESEIAICDAVRMEVLAGARDERHLHNLRRLLARATVFPTGPMHYDDAVALYRLCRREGGTIRRLIDCLIGAVAIRADVPVLHNDADFDVLARHTDLKIAA